MARVARQVHLLENPSGEVRPSHFRIAEVELPEPAEGEVLVRNLFTSVDPALRLQIRPTAPGGYFRAFPLNAPLDGIMSVGEVVQSRAEGFAAGDVVSHGWGWRDLAIVPAGVVSVGGVGTLAKLDTTLGPPEMFLGPLGNMGLTAYVGLVHAAELRDGDIVWISAAAGAVGSIAAQIAKLKGCRVIGSAGSAGKVRFLLEEIGVDYAFDYHDAAIVDHLRAAAPDGIDVYFDNVGGDHLAGGALRPSAVGSYCDMRRDIGIRDDRAPTGTDEYVPGGGERSDPARLPGEQPSRPAARVLAGARRLARRRPPALPPDDHRRPRARSRGARRDARG